MSTFFADTEPEEEGCILELFCPTPRATDDVPNPPPASDFPIGCEVQLVGESEARLVQHEPYWEPWMSDLFSGGRTVTVRRHSGDFTVVSCLLGPDYLVSVSLHRACLKDPQYEPTTNMTSTSHKGSLSNAPSSEQQSARSDSTRSEMCERGNAAFQAGDFRAALHYFTEELKNEESRGCLLYSNRSATCLALGMHSQALDDALRAISCDPKDVRGYVRAGNTYRVMRKFVEARHMYDAALKLDPSSDVLKHLSSSTALSRHFQSATESTPIDVLMNESGEAVVFLCVKAHPAAVLFEEAPIIFVSDFSSQTRGEHCCHCLRGLLSSEDVARHLEGVPPTILNRSFIGTNGINLPQCPHCGEQYCSERCRSDAWAAHHKFECTVGGRWAEGMRTVRTVLADISSHVLATLVMLTVRMFAHMIASDKPIPIAFETFSWLRGASDEYHEVELLQRCHAAISPHLPQAAASELSFAFFCQCFVRVRRCALRYEVTPWPRFAANIASNLEFMRSMHLPGSADAARLEQVISRGGKHIPGMFITVFAIFGIVSSCRTGPQSNVSLHLPSSATRAVRVVAESEINSGSVVHLPGMFCPWNER